MEKIFKGPAIFLDRDDINTDEIIPAKYLTEVTKEALQPYMLEDLKLDGFDPNGQEIKNARAIVTRENFGCGSSREHAPWVFEVNGVHTIIAQSYARIFRQNTFNGGMLAIELPKQDIDALFEFQKQGSVTLNVDVDAQIIHVNVAGQTHKFPFEISEFDKALVKAGGWVEFADARY